MQHLLTSCINPQRATRLLITACILRKSTGACIRNYCELLVILLYLSRCGGKVTVHCREEIHRGEKHMLVVDVL